MTSQLFVNFKILSSSRSLLYTQTKQEIDNSKIIQRNYGASQKNQESILEYVSLEDYKQIHVEELSMKNLKYLNLILIRIAKNQKKKNKYKTIENKDKAHFRKKFMMTIIIIVYGILIQNLILEMKHLTEMYLIFALVILDNLKSFLEWKSTQMMIMNYMQDDFKKNINDNLKGSQNFSNTQDRLVQNNQQHQQENRQRCSYILRYIKRQKIEEKKQEEEKQRIIEINQNQELSDNMNKAETLTFKGSQTNSRIIHQENNNQDKNLFQSQKKVEILNDNKSQDKKFDSNQNKNNNNTGYKIYTQQLDNNLEQKQEPLLVSKTQRDNYIKGYKFC